MADPVTTSVTTVAAARTILVAADGQPWWQFWRGDFTPWFLGTGLPVLLLVIGGILAGRLVNWIARRLTARIDRAERGALVRSETAKHRQAVASVVSWIAIAVIFIVVALEIVDVLNLPVNPLAGPAAVVGAGLGFGARGVIEDLLAGFLIIAEKQYGFGDLVQLELASTATAEGTVEDVTLRVTKLRSSDGEVYTVANGRIVKSTNLSKGWARAVVDIPVPNTADLGLVNEVLRQECQVASNDPVLGRLLLDQPSVMGVESIQVGTVNLRMVARTLPGKQFEAGRKLRALVVRALARAGIVAAGDVPGRVEGLTPSGQEGAVTDASADDTDDDDTDGTAQPAADADHTELDDEPAR